MRELVVALLVRHQLHEAAMCGPDCFCHTLMKELELTTDVEREVKKERERL